MRKNNGTNEDTKNVRMYVADYTRFIKLVDKFGFKSNAQLIRKLLDIYDETEKNAALKDGNEISLNMSFYASCPCTKYLPLKKITFPGNVRFYPTNLYHINLTKSVWKKLQEEFFDNLAPDIYQADELYDFWHTLNLYYNIRTNRYFCHEYILIQLKEENYVYEEKGCPNLLLHVWRGDFVDNYNDLYTKFSRYAHPSNLTAIATLIADDIGEDYKQLNIFFPLRR